MVVVGANDNVFVLQAFVFSRNNGNDVVGIIFGGLLGDDVFLAEIKVLLETFFLLSFYYWLQLHAAKHASNVFRSERVACCGWEPASKFLRCQIFYRLPHAVLSL